MSRTEDFSAERCNGINKEAIACSPEKSYSYQKLASDLCPKNHARCKYYKNRRAQRVEKRKNCRRDSKIVQKEYVEQSLLEHIYPTSILDYVKNYVLNMNSEVDTTCILNMLEICGALTISLPMCKTPTQVASQIFLSMKCLVKGSVIEGVLKNVQTVNWCKDIFGYNIFVEQSGEPEEAGWLSLVPKIKENWDMVRNAPIFSKISTLLTVAVSIGMCSITKLSWNVKGIDMLRVPTSKKHHTALDFVGALLDTIVVFVEGGFECFKTQSFAPLLFSNDASREMDALYFPLIELHEHAMVFNLQNKPILLRGETRVISDIEYSVLLDECIDLADRAYKSARGTWQQGYLEKRREILHKNRAAYQAKRIDGSMRFAPFTVYIWGESGVGKSTISQLIMSDCLNAAGVDPDARGTAIIKESDKYDSSLKGDTVGIYFDDMGNTKKEFLEKSPTERVIDINNNMITYANKADLHEKGKIEIRPRVFVITSNAPLADHGNNGSIKPYSIVRRADVHVCVKVKPEYATEDGRLNGRKVMHDFDGPDLDNPVWDLDLYIPRERKHGGNNSHLISKNGSTEKYTVGIRTALAEIVDMCVAHFANQRKLIEKGQNVVESRQYCSVCRRAANLCLCGDLKTEEQAGLSETFDEISSQFQALGNVRNRILQCVPQTLFNNKYVTMLFLLPKYQDFIRYERTIRYFIFGLYGILLSTLTHFFSFLINRYLLYMYTIFIFLITFICLYVYIVLLARWRDEKLKQMFERKDLTQDIFSSLRQSKVAQFCGMCVTIRVLYGIVQVLKGKKFMEQSALTPQSEKELEQRDLQINPWATAEPAELHVDKRAMTMTHSQMIKKVSNNLLHAHFVEDGFQQKCDALALGGNIFLLPLHLFRNRKDMRVTFTRRNPDLLNSTFKAMVSVNYIQPIEGKDLCIVYVASGGIFSDIKHLFPSCVNASGTGTFLYKEPLGDLRESKVRLDYIKNSESGGAGFAYTLPYNTFTGLCMGVSIADFAKSFIACVHLRGIPNTPNGKGLIVYRKELEEAIQLATFKWKGAFPSVVNGTFPTKRYEQQVLISREIHPKSPVNYLPKGSTIEYIGQTNGRVSHTQSKVVTTPISEAVHKHTGVACNHGPPQFKKHRMWQASLQHSANPSPGIEGSLLEKAYDDYVDHMVKKLQKPEFRFWAFNELRPLNDMQIMCGRDGVRFVDAMKRSTSKGFPLSGPKSDMVEMLDPDDYPDFQCPAEAPQMIVEEMRDMERLLLEGRRCYSIFKACVKDEPTKLGKDKVRVFQAADWATQMLVRKYFLPVGRVLSMFPIDSECAVGVNACGKEWDELARYMKKHGDNRIFAGDYSKYDLRMPAQIMMASFAIYIEIAEKCGEYTEDELRIMRGIAAEISYSCVAYNGDLIIHMGSNPSGQNMTVYLNCTANALLKRAGYYHLCPKNVDPPPFREAVAVLDYGDDVKGSVAEGYDWFNHISYAKFLRERDIIFTMPDKESEPTPYMNDQDADFLKRKNVYNPDTGLIHGALDEESIFKSLHTVLQSKVVSTLDQSISNIDGALREWWQHGREVYEKRREEMKRVAEECNIAYACTMLNQTYEDRLDAFKEMYIK